MFLITLLLSCLPPSHSQLPFLEPLPYIPQLSSWWLILLLLLCLCVLYTHTYIHLYNLLSLSLFACTWTTIKEVHPWERLSLGRDSQKTLVASKSLSRCGTQWHSHASVLTYSLILSCSGLFHTVISSGDISQQTSWYFGSYDLSRPSSHGVSE